MVRNHIGWDGQGDLSLFPSGRTVRGFPRSGVCHKGARRGRSIRRGLGESSVTCDVEDEWNRWRAQYSDFYINGVRPAPDSDGPTDGPLPRKTSPNGTQALFRF